MFYDLQKASIWKRASAFLFDVILLCILSLGIAFLLASVLGFDTYNDSLNASKAQYEAAYGISFDLTPDEQAALTEEEMAVYMEANQAMNADEQVVYAYNMVINLTLLIGTFSILAGFMVIEFAVPLMLGDGRTLGKKIFGVAVMKTNGVRINTVSLFIRTLLGKFTIETMIPLLVLFMMFWGTIGIIGPAVIFTLLIVQLALVITSQNNSMIHDFLSSTVVVDYASQLIFPSDQALVDYQKRIAAENAQQQPY